MPEAQYAEKTVRLAKQLELLTGLESRITILGHLQRGGIPSAADRLLATRLGTACTDLIQQGALWRDGCSQRRWHQGSQSGRSRRASQNSAARPPLGAERTPRRYQYG